MRFCFFVCTKSIVLKAVYVEFDFRTLGDGRSASARYANNSNYRNDSLIRKESAFSLLVYRGVYLTSCPVIVCVSSLMISEIKRIIKESEIMKYILTFPLPSSRDSVADISKGKTTASGQRRTRMGAKNWRSEWAMSISHSKYVFSYFTIQSTMTTTLKLNINRQPKLDAWWMLQNLLIPKG